ncbi:SDR family oxidoreductase [Stenotrophomonas sp. YAU14D1_LEIMI4_1]|uniref:SDR family oxidoreductase n=1 Tax=Stenotrophomonas sp. YAU14D1_LEIMI4_1 TaxID=2072407 RepID=UPI000D5423C7|nr:SDR family oxidoreductase [Stenotrophomonas sp. YAU14D1_LEIMI4_1]AWH25371.1 short chain dehydrogenase [Stenotrophomonas sp. YAU14D1_LEIMI4_1]
MDLRGRTVILTGASGGIGRLLCGGLVGEGAQVVAVGRNHSRLKALTDMLPEGAVIPAVADVGTAAGRGRLLAKVDALPRPPSVLVVGHASAAFGLFGTQTEQALEQLMQTNLVGSMLLIRVLLPLLERQPQASVAVLGSTFGSLAFPGFAAYSASKFGLRGLVEGLGREYAGSTVKFQYLSPRATRTDFNSAAVDAMNAELGVSHDSAEKVASALLQALRTGNPRLQLGWPERLFARLNGLLPELVDRSLRKQLPVVRRHAGSAAAANSSAFHPNKDSSHEAHAG